MSPIAILRGGAAGSYFLRVLFIGLIPGHRLPERARGMLQLVGPAALAALVATDIARAATHPVELWPTVGGAAVAALVSWTTNNLAFTILSGLASAVLIGLIL